MAVDVVDYAVDGPVARLTLNSPHNRNAMSSALIRQLQEGLRRAAGDPAVRTVVLGHAGNTFCAGADLSETAGADPGTAMATRTLEMIALLRAIVECPLPVIAAVDGHVRAGGMGLVGACDIAIAGPRSTFALTEVRIGVAPAMISLTLLPKLTPRAAARYYLTGETFNADRAAEIGLVTRAGMLAPVDPEDDEDLAEDDLPLAEPTDEESNFDDFDDEFDDDFEEEENDPDWDHGDEGEPEPPAKGPGGKK